MIIEENSTCSDDGNGHGIGDECGSGDGSGRGNKDGTGS